MGAGAVQAGSVFERFFGNKLTQKVVNVLSKKVDALTKANGQNRFVIVGDQVDKNPFSITEMQEKIKVFLEKYCSSDRHVEKLINDLNKSGEDFILCRLFSYKNNKLNLNEAVIKTLTEENLNGLINEFRSVSHKEKGALLDGLRNILKDNIFTDVNDSVNIPGKNNPSCGKHDNVLINLVPNNEEKINNDIYKAMIDLFNKYISDGWKNKRLREDIKNNIFLKNVLNIENKNEKSVLTIKKNLKADEFILLAFELQKMGHKLEKANGLLQGIIQIIKTRYDHYGDVVFNTIIDHNKDNICNEVECFGFNPIKAKLFFSSYISKKDFDKHKDELAAVIASKILESANHSAKVNWNIFKNYVYRKCGNIRTSSEEKNRRKAHYTKKNIDCENKAVNELLSGNERKFDNSLNKLFKNNLWFDVSNISYEEHLHKMLAPLLEAVENKIKIHENTKNIQSARKTCEDTIGHITKNINLVGMSSELMSSELVKIFNTRKNISDAQLEKTEIDKFLKDFDGQFFTLYEIFLKENYAYFEEKTYNHKEKSKNLIELQDNLNKYLVNINHFYNAIDWNLYSEKDRAYWLSSLLIEKKLELINKASLVAKKIACRVPEKSTWKKIKDFFPNLGTWKKVGLIGAGVAGAIGFVMLPLMPLVGIPLFIASIILGGVCSSSLIKGFFSDINEYFTFRSENKKFKAMLASVTPILIKKLKELEELGELIKLEELQNIKRAVQLSMSSDNNINY